MIAARRIDVPDPHAEVLGDVASDPSWSTDVSRTLLSPRQKACMALVRQGMTSLQIADVLGLSRRTVDQYVGEACRRLGARNRAQGVAEAALRGEI